MLLKNICKLNVIHGQAQFKKQCREPGKSAKSLISAVYKLAENCQYGVLQDGIIRDRLVVGIRRHGLSEKKQQETATHCYKELQKGKRRYGWCGKAPTHSLNNCIAQVAECRKCHKKGHLQLFVDLAELIESRKKRERLFSSERCLQEISQKCEKRA